ncbi:hypothetical protein COLO4_35281 [Corchorus olitorius]|uniref:PB1-like domain-containing protein n=1 Tax=Corchorus olitorius TaxID=93759 RepID=A0A1R3GHM9_9ROSI|nr:hypothetical protein COLO4_35281 [Corchorus olitorius]
MNNFIMSLLCACGACRSAVLRRDPYLRYEGGEKLRGPSNPDTYNWKEITLLIGDQLKYRSYGNVYFHNTLCKTFDDGMQLLFDDKSVLRMIGIWEKVRLMTIYVEHDIVDDPVDPPLVLNSSDGDNFVSGIEGNNVIAEEDEGNNLSGANGAFKAAEAVNEGPNIDGGSQGFGEIPVDLIDENEEVLERNGIKKALLVRTKCLSDGEGDEELERGRELAFKAARKVFRKLKKKGGKKASKKGGPSSVPVDDARGDEQDPVPPIPQDPENEAEVHLSSTLGIESDDNVSIVESDNEESDGDEQHTGIHWSKSKWVHYNPLTQIPEFTKDMGYSKV